MKYRIVIIVVKTYRRGPRQGSYRPFDLPEGALILGSRVMGLDSDLYVRVAVPA